MLLSMSCTTLPPDPVKVDISWPAFPDPAGLIKDRGDGTVSMPADYWLAIVRYVVDAEAAHKKYEAERDAR